MSMVKFVETIKSILPTVEFSQGQLIYCSDTMEAFFDTSENTRIIISDIVYMDTEEIRGSLLAPLANKLYIVKESKNIYKYDTTLGWYILSINLSNIKLAKLQCGITPINNGDMDIFFNIPEYDKTTDILEVYKNGNRLFEIYNYTILSNSSISLVNSVTSVGEFYMFQVYKIKSK